MNLPVSHDLSVPLETHTSVSVVRPLSTPLRSRRPFLNKRFLCKTSSHVQLQSDSEDAPVIIHTNSSKDEKLITDNSTIHLHIDNVNIMVAASDKPIIRDVTLKAKSGDVIGVLGLNNSGKTTLLNYIASGGKKLQGLRSEGGVYINGELVRNHKYGKRLFGYSGQHVDALENLTAWDTVRYKGLLKVPMTVSKCEFKARMEAIFVKLKLTSCRDVLVGGERLQGCSGGQRKRVMVAGEIVSRSPILVLDEPTTGLDTYAAGILITLLKEIAVDHNCIVLLSLHQPTSHIFYSLTRAIFLVDGGIIADKSPYEYFNICKDINRPCIEGDSVCEHMINMIKDEEALNSIVVYRDLFMETESDALPSLKGNMLSVVQLLKEHNLPSRPRRIYTLMLRHFNSRLSYHFSPYTYVARVIIYFMLSLFWAGMRPFNGYVSPDYRTSLGIIMFVSASATTNAGKEVFGFPEERGVIQLELNKGLYSELDINLARILPETLFISCHGLMYLLILILTQGIYSQFVRHLKAVILLVLNVTATVALGKTLANLFPNVRTALSFGEMFLNFGFFMSGFFVNMNFLPVFVRNIRYFVPMSLFFLGIADVYVAPSMYECSDKDLHRCDNVGELVSGIDLLEEGSINVTWGTSVLCLIILTCSFEVIAGFTRTAGGPRPGF